MSTPLFVAKLSHAEYSKRQEQCSSVHDWVVDHVKPSLAVLLASAATEEQRLSLVLSRLGQEIVGFET